MQSINEAIIKLLRDAGVNGEIELSAPPSSEMGDLAFACFGLAKEWKMNPAEAAKAIGEKIAPLCHPRENGDPEIGRRLDSLPAFAGTKGGGNDNLVERVVAIGPYLNFFLNASELARLVLGGGGRTRLRPPWADYGGRRKIMVEFAHPNTHKPVHIGHLRNMITGDSLARIFENAGHKIVRANYQGDVGMHIAKCLWGILQISNFKFQISKLMTIGEKARFLGEAYAMGGTAYEKDETAKKEIEEINAKIYAKDKSIWSLYKKTRKWSLDYFNYIYKKVGIKKFNRLYFESEVFKPGVEIVKAGLEKNIFKESQGAIIFEGSKHGLHDRVFINSKGLPTYEAKDMALAKLQFKEYHPDCIYHVVAKEQTDYFKVIFKAMEFLLPESAGKEKHLVYGWVSLKDGKMSSRTGNVVLAEWLLDEVEKKIFEIMKDKEIRDKENTIKKITNAAIKYSMLKTGIGNDIAFDFNESISLSGDSGPYLLYIVARINSILKKTHNTINKTQLSEKIEPAEKKLLLELARYEEAVKKAAEEKDPSVIAKYLFALAQGFNNFYQSCPVLEAEPAVRDFRLRLVKKVKEVMEKGLDLLGIEAVEEM